MGGMHVFISLFTTSRPCLCLCVLIVCYCYVDHHVEDDSLLTVFCLGFKTHNIDSSSPEHI